MMKKSLIKCLPTILVSNLMYSNSKPTTKEEDKAINEVLKKSSKNKSKRERL